MKSILDLYSKHTGTYEHSTVRAQDLRIYSDSVTEYKDKAGTVKIHKSDSNIITTKIFNRTTEALKIIISPEKRKRKKKKKKKLWNRKSFA